MPGRALPSSLVSLALACTPADAPPSPTAAASAPAGPPALDLTRPPGLEPPRPPPPAPAGGYPHRRERLLAASERHTCAVRAEGRVLCWGGLRDPANGYPQIEPQWIPELRGVTSLAAGRDHACGLRDGGEVVCWDALEPARPIAGLPPAVALSAAGKTTCALAANGDVRCWDHDQDSFGASLYTGALPGATMLARGDEHLCFGTGARIACQGGEQYGQGNVPDGLVGAVDLVAGNVHTCALLGDGEVLCWGNNVGGQLGAGPRGPGGAPTRVPGLRDAVELGAGFMFSCARTRDGRVLCWGANNNGQLGVGDLAEHSGPVEVRGLRGVVALAVGSEHACAMQDGGDLVCWGDNISAQLGVGDDDRIGRPAPIRGLPAVVELAAGTYHGCAREASGAVWCWGSGKHGQLGGEFDYKRLVPARVPDLDDAEALALGDFWSCARRRGGTLSCWGGFNIGVPERDSGESISRPIALPLRDVISVAVGRDHLCAAGSDGVARCWGSNDQGQLGDGTRTTRWSPAPVAGPGGLVQLAAGREHTCARDQAGGLWCWGAWDERRGEAWSRRSSATPIAIDGWAQVDAVVAAEGQTCAHTRDGRSGCWGLGAALQATWPAGAIDQIVTGGAHVCALQAGRVRCVGDNDGAQLGDGTRTRREQWTEVTELPPTRALAAGVRHTCALDEVGVVRCWGWNHQYGTIAWPEFKESPLPLRIPLRE